MDHLDTGTYNFDQELYTKLVQSIYEKYPAGVTLPPEYAEFVQDNLLRMYIRLARYKFVARIIQPSDNVLEVGSGSGLGSLFLGQHAQSVKGIDIKTTEVREAQLVNQRKNVSFEVADLFDLPPSGKYDCVVALDVIEHMPGEAAENLLHAIAGQLQRTGIAIIGTPSVYSYPHQGPLSQASHFKCYDQAELLSLMSQHFERCIPFSMNDEIVHTGHPKMAWYYFVLGLYPKRDS